MTRQPDPRMLLVGAFERDNFGDMLFLLQTEELLSGVRAHAAAPFAADVSAQLDRTIPAYGGLLNTEPFDHIWVVGGEVGATTLEDAYRMASEPDEYTTLRGMTAPERAVALRRLSGLDADAPPYIPRPTAFPANAAASLVVNSAGFVNLTTAPSARQREVLDVLREADAVSVRDRVSSDFLTTHSIPHRLAPDLIQSIAVTRPRGDRSCAETALVQASEAYLSKVGHESFARALARSSALAELTITLFFAGTAPGHDSADSYRRVAEHFRRIAPGREIRFSSTTRPWERPDEIARARLWVGSSLHGRIVAMAYGVPRVSLAKRKLSTYASSWDPEMPHGVTPGDLGAAIDLALSPRTARISPSPTDVGQLALDEFRSMAAAVLDSSHAERVVRRFAHLEDRRARELAEGRERIRQLEARLRLQEQLLTPPRRAGALAHRVWGRIRYR